MTKAQEETYNLLLKIPNIHPSGYPNTEEGTYLRVVGNKIICSIKVHKSGDFSFVYHIKGKFKYVKNVDIMLGRLFPSTIVGIAFHMDKLYTKG